MAMKSPGTSDLGALREERRDILGRSPAADYVYTVTMHRGKWIATFHGAGCKAVTGYTPKEMDDDPWLWHRMIHNDDRDAVLKQFSNNLKNSEWLPIEHRILSKSGEVRWIRNAPVLQRDGPGGIVSYNGVISDITDRKRAEKEVRRSRHALAQKGDDLSAKANELRATDQKLKSAELVLIQVSKLESVGRLAAGVAHEVKNPLQTILMGIDFLDANIHGSRQGIIEALNEMREAVRRASGIIQGLLELSAKTEYQIDKGDLNSCVSKALNLVHYELEAAKTKVVLELAPDLPKLRMDPQKLEQAFINIFLNALQAMGHAGLLDIKTWRCEAGPDSACSTIVLEVKDSGPGIPEADLDKVFDPFFTAKAVGSGTGLGLSIVQNIIHLHSGTIKIANAPASGAIVTINFQIKEHQ